MQPSKQVLQQEAYPALKNIGFSDTPLEPPFISEYFILRSYVPIWNHFEVIRVNLEVPCQKNRQNRQEGGFL